MIYSSQSDETLVLLTLAGEQQAYEVLVLRYEQSLIAAANSILHNINLAEDAAQDAFITAWMKLNLLREPAKYGIWAKRIAKNCAKNIAIRFKSYLSLEALDNCIPDEDDYTGNPEIAFISSENRKQLHESISGLSEKVKKVIHLYYFEGLSIVEIADIMSISAGTVKRQLYDGRKQLRKDLCAMNEDMNDALVQRVMKKVEELKLWKLKNNKDGFESVYKDVLAEVEELPESQKKYHALADVLMHGWWWIPGKKNDELLKRICEAAKIGKNEEVMAFILSKEDYNIWDPESRADFILNKQIPRLEEGGFVRALGIEWYRLGESYLAGKKPEKGFEAIEKALSILQPSELYYSLARFRAEMSRNIQENYSDKDLNRCAFITNCVELRNIGGLLYNWDYQGSYYGSLWSIDWAAPEIIYNASRCDNRFPSDGLNPGEVYTGTDGSTLTFAADCETVETDCGSFTGCQLWIIKDSKVIVRTWYKSGVGIVRQQFTSYGTTETRTLKAYKIIGGSGLLPLANGNEWEYTADSNPEVLNQSLKLCVSYSDDKKSIITTSFYCERLKYDDNSWAEMILQIRNDYWNSSTHKCQDIYYPMERAELLAKTPVEKAHTKAACSVARRILETNPEFNPNYTAEGRWNFFDRNKVIIKEGKVCLGSRSKWAFELKCTSGLMDYQVLYNNVIEILQDNTGCIWSDEWKPGAKCEYDHDFYSDPLHTAIICEAEPLVATKAGSFENCLKLCIETKGFDSGHDYMGGKKEYYFANGIGVVKTVNYYADEACIATYELSSYEGTGEGYMPIINGAVRRYDAIGLTDGFVGSAEYTFVLDDEGEYTVVSDRCGIRKVLDDITDYGSILGERIEDRLWGEWKTDESYVQHGINNLNLLIFFLMRYNDRFWNPGRTASWRKYKLRFLESLGGGEVPKAWLGVYAWWLFTAGGAMIGAGEKDEGYEYIEKAIELYPKWLEIPDGEALDLGEEFIFCGVKAVKGKNYVLLPDGKKAAYNDQWVFCNSICDIYGAMTSTTAWGWLDSARNEERFKKDVEKARAIIK